MSPQVKTSLVIACIMLACAGRGSQAQDPLRGRLVAPEKKAPPLPAGLGIAGDRAPQSMPLHPNVLSRIRAEGYDSISIVNLRRLAELKRSKGIDEPAPLLAPVIGTRPALVLLVDYSDLTHNTSSTPSLYDSLLFSSGTYPAPGSMRDFYQEASYGLFDISPSLVDGSWRQVANAHNYYADADGIPSTSDDYGEGSYPQNAQGLVVDAVALADPFVNFASYAVGGHVQGLFVIHAGRGAETDPSHTDWIWSHMWGLNEHAVTVDGVTVNVYSMEPEYTLSAGDSTVGVFCHEYGHVLGLPDLYDTDYSSEGLGNWSLMAGGSWNGSNGTSPAHPDAWCKIQLGWVDPLVPTANETGATIPRIEDNAVAYALWTGGAVGTEYFVLENRQLVGFDSALDGNGLLLYHVDELVPDNDSDWHPKVMVEQADGLWDLQYGNNGGDAGDPYPGSSGNRVANSSTTPDTRSYAGVATGVAVQSISDSAANMSADILVGEPLIIHVKPGGDDLNDGLSWTTAKQTVQAGIDAAQAGDQVWVAAGYYMQYPIQMKNEVGLYGGFAGSETSLDERDFRANVTTLDANSTGTVVQVTEGATTATRIDGFTIRGGYGHLSGGMGGGISIYRSSPTIANNRITGNIASYGGGIYSGPSPTIAEGPVIVDNIIADNHNGGGIHCWGYADIVGNTITGNSGAVYGGGICAEESYATIANNIVANNSQRGIGLYVSGALWLRNNCVYGNTSGNYSGILPGFGDISEDPQFVDLAGGDLHLLPTSPCIDAGEDSYVGPQDMDMDGQPRIYGAHVDIGADELYPPLRAEVVLEVHPNERAPGAGTNQYIGAQPWTQPMTGPPQGSYWWKKYAFAAHGPLWVQACAQNWDKNQKGYLDHDDTKLTVNGVTVTDYDGLQSGAPGTWQWTGGAESGQRVTLRFLVPVVPGKQDLWIGADESPALWWLKVIDLEPGVVSPL